MVQIAITAQRSNSVHAYEIQQEMLAVARLRNLLNAGTCYV